MDNFFILFLEIGKLYMEGERFDLIVRKLQIFQN